MKKIKSKSVKKEVKLDSLEEREPLISKIIIIVSFFIPFVFLYLLKIIGIKLPKRTKMIASEIINKNFTMLMIYLLILAFARYIGLVSNNTVIYMIPGILMIIIFILSAIIQIKMSIRWLNGENVRYKRSWKFFKED